VKAILENLSSKKINGQRFSVVVRDRYTQKVTPGLRREKTAAVAAE